ncbi:MAG: hypothetical protein Q8T09_00915 [Candidatus Melainabacteria bacterium]|nr:hypothetical protein [Candidatus Melainabacteria bacterium]
MQKQLITLHSELQRHAFIQYGKCEPQRVFAQPIKLSDLPSSTFALAKFLKPGITQEQMLHAFFSAEAVGVMLTLPNQYWFWKVAHDAVSYASADPNSVIAAKAVHLAIACNRNGQSHRYDMGEELEDLTNDEIGNRLEHGICLMDSQTKMVRNWMFYPAG